MLHVKNLCFSYTTSSSAIQDISFVAKEGEITAILGPNGAGKSTLFHLILGTLKAHSGEIQTQDTSLMGLSLAKRARHISYVPQEWHSPFNYTTLDVVLMGLSPKLGLFSQPSKSDIQKANDILTLLGITHLGERGIGELSGGERQMALLGRALMQDTPILLLDEPTSHLDLKNQMKILSILEHLAKTTKLCIVVTLHDPNLASQYANRIVAIKKGKVYHSGNVQEMMDKQRLEGLYDHPIELTTLDGHPIMRGKKECFCD
jgi:iron complex transport system ATP-binding protein